MVAQGKLRALAVTSPTRLDTLPAVPTLAESGITSFQMKEWEGVVAPAGTPRTVIDKWNHELAYIIGQPEIREQAAKLGMVPAAPNSPDEFGTLIRGELDYWTRFVKSTGIRTG
jgi:tripartite-type tricarboxylate transporter receptor subunit TctC